MNNERFSHLSNHKYIGLETFRKNEIAVRTHIWFIQSQDLIYMRTDEKSGKVKRLRNNPRTSIAPS
jgi:PPOX class probable F420-dependent enzyme